MKTTTFKSAVLFLGAMMLPISTSFMGVDVVSDALAAGNDTAQINVSANIPAKCNFTGGTIAPIAFGEYDPVGTNASTPLDQTGDFQVRCNKNTNATLALDDGLNASGGVRRMNDSVSGDFLNYALFQDAGRSIAWGSSIGVDTKAYVATTSSFSTQTIYGRIPAGQDAAAVGSYVDTVTITVSF